VSTSAGKGGGRLSAVPPAVERVAAQWSLDVGPPFEPGGTSVWVAPARSADGDDLVLKVSRRHPEAEDEAAGLRVWNGDGAVQLRDAMVVDESTAALLLERCDPGSPLSTRPETEQDVVVAALLQRLWAAPAPLDDFRPLSAMCDMWSDGFEGKLATLGSPLDPGLLRAGVELFRSLPLTAERSVLLCTDLHAGNILASQRQPWLVIDPKPYVGDPAYDPLQHMLNCKERLQSAPRDLAARMSDLLDLDVDRVLLWLFARCVIESIEWEGLGAVAVTLAPT
jgi:streptomycin 6-kinase